MIDIPGELEGIEIEIEIEGGTEAIADDLRKAFNGEDEDVVFGHSFGGVDFVRGGSEASTDVSMRARSASVDTGFDLRKAAVNAAAEFAASVPNR